MQIDKITLSDISIFNTDEEFSVFHKLNFTKTSAGKEWLKFFFSHPFTDLEKILATQKVIHSLQKMGDNFPKEITNGTILVMHKYLDYDLDTPPAGSGAVNAFMYKMMHSSDYSMIQFSVKHFADFLRDMKKITAFLATEELPDYIKFYNDHAQHLMKKTVLQKMADSKKGETYTIADTLTIGYHIFHTHRKDLLELIDIYGRIDAWHSMAIAVSTWHLCFPEFIKKDTPLVNAKGLYHVLLPKPVAYDIEMNPENNFLFLTGANMAGKSTLIKSVGVAVFLAHIGMGVPSKEMQLTLFSGLLTNINVVDNIVKGESFFFNEVQRIKNTIEKINDGSKWLVLIDELFKGTNVQDAMKCSTTVIKGLIKIKNSLFILSTHLYEIGEELKVYPNISFKYFETTVNGDQLEFSYQLKDGISNDRFGYLILKKEKVVDLLEKL